MSKSETRVEMMRYRPNKISFWLCMLALVFNVAMFLIIYKETNCEPSFQLGFDLLINVIVMLACFLAGEKQKAYDFKAGIIGIVIAVIQVARIFWIPLSYYVSNIEYNNAVANGEIYSGAVGLTSGQFMVCVILLVCSALSILGASLITMQKSKELKKHLANINKESR